MQRVFSGNSQEIMKMGEYPMKKLSLKQILVLCGLVIGVATLNGCDSNKGPAPEKAGEKVEKAAEPAAKTGEEAGKKVDAAVDAAKNAAAEVGQKVDQSIDAAKKAAAQVGDKVEKAADAAKEAQEKPKSN